MPEATSAREGTLSRVRGIVGAEASAATVQTEWQQLPREYRVSTGMDEAAKLHLLIDRLHDYDAQVYRIAPEAIATTVAAIARALALSEVLTPAGIDRGWLPQSISFVEDRGFAPHELDRFTAVLTASTLAIAETGTLVLQNLPGQGRRAATLVPDVHLCVVRVQDVVHTVPEAMRRLQATADLPTTFISGPSATADIEMTRIKGVHGPRFLHVLLVD